MIRYTKTKPAFTYHTAMTYGRSVIAAGIYQALRLLDLPAPVPPEPSGPLQSTRGNLPPAPPPPSQRGRQRHSRTQPEYKGGCKGGRWQCGTDAASLHQRSGLGTTLRPPWQQLTSVCHTQSPSVRRTRSRAPSNEVERAISGQKVSSRGSKLNPRRRACTWPLLPVH